LHDAVVLLDLVRSRQDNFMATLSGFSTYILPRLAAAIASGVCQ
jgi:hypothetical protein